MLPEPETSVTFAADTVPLFQPTAPDPSAVIVTAEVPLTFELSVIAPLEPAPVCNVIESAETVWPAVVLRVPPAVIDSTFVADVAPSTRLFRSLMYALPGVLNVRLLPSILIVLSALPMFGAVSDILPPAVSRPAVWLMPPLALTVRLALALTLSWNVALAPERVMFVPDTTPVLERSPLVVTCRSADMVEEVRAMAPVLLITPFFPASVVVKLPVLVIHKSPVVEAVTVADAVSMAATLLPMFPEPVLSVTLAAVMTPPGCSMAPAPFAVRVTLAASTLPPRVRSPVLACRLTLPPEIPADVLIALEFTTTIAPGAVSGDPMVRAEPLFTI